MHDNRALRTALAGLAGLATAMGIGRFVFTPLLPGMMAGLHLSVAQAGWLASVNFIGYLLGAVLSGGRWAQGRERAVALTALLLSSLMAGAMALGSDFALLLLIRFVAGVASAFCLVFLATIILHRLAAFGRDDLQALFFAGVGAGIALSALLTGAITLGDASWRWGWMGAAALSLLGTLLVVWLLEPAPRSQAKPPHEPPLPRDRSFWAITVAYGFFGAGYVVTVTFLVAIVRANNSGPLIESAVWLVTGLAAIPSLYLWATVVRRLGLTATYALACGVEAIGVVASVTIPGWAGPILGGILMGGTFMAITGYGQVAGRTWAKHSPRKALAVMTVFLGVGQVVGPIAAGYLAHWTQSFLVPSLGAAILLLVSGAIALWSGRGRGLMPTRRDPSQTPPLPG